MIINIINHGITNDLYIIDLACLISIGHLLNSLSR
jgi:hypothetical protein